MNMLVYFLFIIILCYSQSGLLKLSTVIPQTEGVNKWYVKYLSSIDGEPTHAINEVGFDKNRFETNVEDDLCTIPLLRFDSLANLSGYVYCTNKQKGIVRRCPSDTVASFKVGGCVNRTTNQTILPIGSRCASQPCQNGGTCYDFPSADAFFCECPPSYEGVHCHARTRTCEKNACGGVSSQMKGVCRSFPSDRALSYYCECQKETDDVLEVFFAPSNCHKDDLHKLNCTAIPNDIVAVPFTNKGYYVCRYRWLLSFVLSCRVGHVWNDTQKECVQE